MSGSHGSLRLAALALLNAPEPKGLTRKAGSFLGQCAVDPAPLTEAQSGWLDALLRKNGFSPLGGAQ